MQYSGSQQTASDDVASMARPALKLAHWMILRMASESSSVRFVCSLVREAKHLTTEGLADILTMFGRVTYQSVTLRAAPGDAAAG